MADIEELRKAGQGRLDVTVGSALDIFGGSIPFEALAKMKQYIQIVKQMLLSHQSSGTGVQIYICNELIR